MRTAEFLEYLIGLEVKWEKRPTMRSIAKEFGVSPSAVNKHLKLLIKRWLLEKVAVWKYVLKLEWSAYEKEFYIRRIRFLEDKKFELEMKNMKKSNLIVWLEECNEELEKSCLNERKSADFLRKQNKIINEVVENQKKEILHLKWLLYEKNTRNFKKRNWFRRLFGL